MKQTSMLVVFWFSLLLLLALMTGCTSNAVKTEPTKQEELVVEELAWKNKAWSKVLAEEIESKLPKFELAKDIPCEMKSLSKAMKIKKLSKMFVKIAKFESGYNVKSSFRESNGVYSLGLYQLSYGDRFCPKSKAEADLHDPVVNIKCAVNIAAHFVEKDQLLAAGGYVALGAPPARGMARYWSVMRVPDKRSKHHKAEILKALCEE